ncbi:MAG TPA: hypothetical protein VIF09_06500 [Polyangiaceae bacterium]
MSAASLRVGVGVALLFVAGAVACSSTAPLGAPLGAPVPSDGVTGADGGPPVHASGDDGSAPPPSSSPDGSAPGCSAAGGDPCAVCNAAACCGEEQACANDPACSILLRCLSACGSDSTCIDACGGAVPAATLKTLVAALDCSSAHCTAACAPPVADAGTCGATPTLHPGTPGSLYCGPGLTCSGGDECCLGGQLSPGQFAPEQCAPRGSACSNGSTSPGGTPAIPIACSQVSDCTANGVTGAVACCLQNATAPAEPPGCTYPRSTLGSAVACESTPCGPGEVTLCTTQADCPAHTTCTPGKWKIYQVGFCL